MKNNDLKPYDEYLLEIARKHGKAQVFEDFLQIVVCCLQMGRAEEQYFTTIKPYDTKELKLFSMAFGSLVEEMTRKPLEDALGQYYENNLSDTHNGQFFTPQSLSDMVAALSAPNIRKGEDNKKDKRVYDPTCGSGRLLLSFAKKDRNHYFVGADISYTCCLMTLINLCLFSLNGEVLHMNSLTTKVWHRWLVIVDTFTKLPTIYEVKEKEAPPTCSSEAEPMKLQGNIQPIKNMQPQIKFVRFKALS